MLIKNDNKIAPVYIKENRISIYNNNKESAIRHFRAINSVTNVSVPVPRRPDKQTDRLTKSDACNEEKRCKEKKSETLDQRVNEIKSNLDCLLTAIHQKHIHIETDNFSGWVPLKEVILPSGNVTYAGFFENRLLVSDLRIYHLEHIASRPPMDFRAAMALIYANFVQAYDAYSAYPPRYVAGHRTATNSHAPLQHAVSQAGHDTATHWRHLAWSVKDRLIRWWADVTDPLTFPQACAQRGDHHTDAARTTLVYQKSAEFVAKLGSDEDSRQRAAKTHFNERSAKNDAPPITTGATTTGASTVPHRSLYSIPLSAMIFKIESYENKLSVPNNEARKLMQSLENGFSAEYGLILDHLDLLLLFDKYIGGKIVEIFHRGLYLKADSQAFDLIVFKRQTELLIQFLNISIDKVDIKNKINKYSKSQIRIDDYLTYTQKLLGKAYELIDSDIIIETVQACNYKWFDTAREEIIEKLKNEQVNRKPHFNKLLQSLKIMQEAHEEYRRLLVAAKDSTIDRAAYLNSKNIYRSIITSDKDDLTVNLIKLKFYHIFEYTRRNGISIHTNHFLIPGELSQYWRLFDEDEEELTYLEMDNISTAEIISFVNSQHHSHQHLDRLYKIIEFTRLSDKNIITETTWDKKNIRAYDESEQILTNLIKNEGAEKLKFVRHSDWHKDLGESIKKTKILVIILAYIKELQMIFNEHLDFYKKNDVNIQEDSDEQHFVAAKITAKISFSPVGTYFAPDYILLQEYEKEISEGNLSLLLRAVAFWFLSKYSNIDEKKLINQNVLNILKQFLSLQNRFKNELQMRLQRSFTSVYTLKPYQQDLFLEDYYQQFIEYNLHDSFSEAQVRTVKSLDNSNFTLNYIDSIYPPQYIYTYKIYSRNYVTNSLTPGHSVYSPTENIGFVSIFRSKSGKLLLMASLASFSFIKNISHLEEDPLINKLAAQWQKKNTQRNFHIDEHIGLSQKDVFSLFHMFDNDQGTSNHIMDIFLIKPKEAPVSQPAPDYTLVAFSKKDILSITGPYTMYTNEADTIMNPKLALLTTLDYINQASLITISRKLKTILRNHSWPEYILHFIPFYKTLCQHWYDAEHKVTFDEVMFDLFDLSMMLISIGAGVKKITDVTLKTIINTAMEHKIPPKLIRQFFWKQLILAVPEVGVKSANVAAKEMLSFLNPINSIPLGGNIFAAIKIRIANANQGKVLFSSTVEKYIPQKSNLRKSWQAEVDESKLTLSDEGIFTDHSGSTERNVIKHNDAFYQVIKDADQNSWRIVNQQDPQNSNFAIPVIKNYAGKWVSMNILQAERKFSSVSFYNLDQNTYSYLDIIKYESTPNLGDIAEELDESTVMHKRILRFFLNQNKFVRELITDESKQDNFLDKFYGTFFFKKEMLALLEFNPDSLDAKSAVRAMETINARKDGIIRFRTICAWRNELDQQPMMHLALSIEIEDKIYIIDLYEMRSHFNPKQRKDVFTEREWVMAYNVDTSDEFELIKYKDFELITDAKVFQLSEAISTISYIFDGFLLKEPFWYRSLVASEFTSLNNAKYTDKPQHDIDFFKAMRTVRFNKKMALSMEKYPVHILYNCGELSEENAKKAIDKILIAKEEASDSLSMFSGSFEITTPQQLMKINQGKIVAIYNPVEQLEHLLLSLGDGRYTGLQNSFFDPTFPDRVSIIIAEHMVIFDGEYFKIRHTDKFVKIFAGTLFGANEDMPIFPDKYSCIKKIKLSTEDSSTEANTHLISREQALFGSECEITLIRDTQKRLKIKLSDAPFQVNGLDPIEFSDIIRGLPYLDNFEFTLPELAMIELWTSYGGYGDHYSIAQILANQFNIPVQLYPQTITDKLESRRTEWFKLFHPIHAHMSAAERATMHASDSPRLRQAQKNHRRLRDLISLVRSVTDPGTLSTPKNIYQYFPAIYIDIIRFIIPKEKYAPRSINKLYLSQDSIHLLYQIRSEYDLDISAPHHIIEQAFLDIIFSIPELNYLTHFFTTTSNHRLKDVAELQSPMGNNE